jgi:hypothetical protein
MLRNGSLGNSSPGEQSAVTLAAENARVRKELPEARGVTLRVVYDLATKEFMVRVYGLVEKEGMGYGEAMAKVRREFIRRKDYSDPYFRSPFVLCGRWGWRLPEDLT